MKTVMKTLWLCCPFVAAVASDCGVPLKVIAFIEFGWSVSAFAWLEIIRRKAEKREQRRLCQCRKKLTQSESK